MSAQAGSGISGAALVHAPGLSTPHLARDELTLCGRDAAAMVAVSEDGDRACVACVGEAAFLLGAAQAIISSASMKRVPVPPRDDRATYVARQVPTLGTARNHHQRWSEYELSVALDYSIKASDAAKMIGRTYAAVVNRRQVHRQGHAATPAKRA